MLRNAMRPLFAHALLYNGNNTRDVRSGVDAVRVCVYARRIKSLSYRWEPAKSAPPMRHRARKAARARSRNFVERYTASCSH